MNKLRIMELAQELASVPDNDTGYAKHYILDDIENELDAKPVMPKVFDEWDYEEHECCDCYEMEIENLISMYFKNDLASYNGRMLLKWINQGEFKDNMSRLLKCIDAIRYGYEVSDDEE